MTGPLPRPDSRLPGRTGPARTVIIAAHGPDRGTADPTRRLAHVLAGRLLWQDPQTDWRIRPAFLRGDGPDLFPDVLAALPAGTDVTILPHFAAGGAFTRRIIPARLTESGSHLTVSLLPPLGTDPAVRGEIAATLAAHPGSDLLLVGHGSADGTPSPLLPLAESFRQNGRRAAAVFIETAPALPEWRHCGLGPEITVIALFAGFGRHVRHDLPSAFGLPPDSLRHGGSYDIPGHRLHLAFPLTDAAIMARIAAARLTAA